MSTTVATSAIPLHEAVQRRVATVAIGASVTRGSGAAGVVSAVSEHLAGLPLARFGVAEPRLYAAALNSATTSTQACMPARARSWGLARKCLNLFLRDAFYNRYLASQFRLQRAEALFEVPLDSVVARELKRWSGRGTLPQWPGLKHVSANLSEQFQAAALECARAMGIPRVHLDTYLWVAGR